ncbi:AAA family ATPase [Actinacidiphila glaucinigra]|uniref:AAA family ATPase n=1 Tax=Actinacidiphila glaucinigra TaxID=235986 RepID=UPI0037A31F70
MKLMSVSANQFMSFNSLQLDLNGDSVVITGPNSAGKSNIGRVVDVVRSTLGAYSGDADRERLELYSRAPRLGGRRFRASIEIELDQDWEKELVSTFVRSAYLSGVDENTGRGLSRRSRETDVDRRLNPESLWPLFKGQLNVRYNAGSRQPWTAEWMIPKGEERISYTIDLLNGDRLRRRIFRVSEQVVPLATAWVQTFPDREILPRNDGPKIDFDKLLTHDNWISLQFVTPSDSDEIPESLRTLGRMLGKKDLSNQSFSFTQVLSAILKRGIVLTDNRRLPLSRSYDLADLRKPADLQDGSRVPGELFRLKNGPLEERQRYESIRGLFSNLAGRPFEVQAEPDPEQSGSMLIDVTIPEGGLEYPIAFSGAGRQEALVLSTLVAGAPGRVLVLDEPAVHIEPTLQRRLVHALQDRAQCIVITHSSDLVPIAKPGDLMRIVRLAPSSSGSTLRRISSELDGQQQARWLQRLGSGDARSLLFAAGAVLCEGPTEVGALSVWWEENHQAGWVPPSGTNIALVDVGGDHGFGTYIDFLRVFGIPWTVVADGPALSPGSKLHKYLDAEQILTRGQPSSEDFDDWKNYWKSVGVFTVADSFGIDGSKSGEFEAFLERLDASLYEQVGQDIGRRSKPRIGAAFASRHPAPGEVIDLYQMVRRHMIPAR